MKIKRWKKTDNLKSKPPHPQLCSANPSAGAFLPSFSIETALGLMATKSLVSATATLGIERRGGQGREDPGIPGCHPRSRPRVPRLLPPPLAAASARETRRSGAEKRGEEQGDPPPSRHLPSPPPAPPAAPAPPTSRAAPERRPTGRQQSPPDAPVPPDLEVSGNRGRSGYPESSPTP